MGMTSLTLVKPIDFPSEKANFRAVSAVDVVEKARVVADVDAAIADCELVIGTSARNRRIPWPLLDPRACAEKWLRNSAAAERLRYCLDGKPTD